MESLRGDLKMGCDFDVLFSNFYFATSYLCCSQEETESILQQTYDEIEEQKDYNEADNSTWKKFLCVTFRS